MLSGKEVSMLDALSVSLASMLVVFVVLLILFIAVKMFPVIFREKKAAPETAAAVAEKNADEDEDELLAVITAAVQSYERENKDTGISLARNYKR